MSGWQKKRETIQDTRIKYSRITHGLIDSNEVIMSHKGYVLARRYVGSTGNRYEQKPKSEYNAVDMFDGDDDYGEADRERIKQQRANPDYVYEIFSKSEWVLS
jgi:hypothetical protein